MLRMTLRDALARLGVADVTQRVPPNTASEVARSRQWGDALEALEIGGGLSYDWSPFQT